jgi:hypothetical protein
LVTTGSVDDLTDRKSVAPAPAKPRPYTTATVCYLYFDLSQPHRSTLNEIINQSPERRHCRPRRGSMRPDQAYLTETSHAPQAHNARRQAGVSSSSASGVVIKGFPYLMRPRLTGKASTTPRFSLRRKSRAWSASPAVVAFF